MHSGRYTNLVCTIVRWDIISDADPERREIGGPELASFAGRVSNKLRIVICVTSEAMWQVVAIQRAKQVPVLQHEGFRQAESLFLLCKSFAHKVTQSLFVEVII